MPSTMIDSKIFRDWFGSQEMREIFTDEYRLQRWLDVEAALARVQGRLGKPEITWHAARDRIAEFVSLLASTCATMGKIAMKAHESGEAFKEALLADERVASHLGPEKIDQLLDPEKYTGLSLELVDRLIEKN